MSGEILFESPITKRQNLITFLPVCQGDGKLSPDVKVKAGEALDDGFNPPDVEHGGATVLLPATKAIIKLKKADKAFWIMEQLL